MWFCWTMPADMSQLPSFDSFLNVLLQRRWFGTPGMLRTMSICRSRAGCRRLLIAISWVYYHYYTLSSFFQAFRSP